MVIGSWASFFRGYPCLKDNQRVILRVHMAALSKRRAPGSRRPCLEIGTPICWAWVLGWLCIKIEGLKQNDLFSFGCPLKPRCNKGYPRNTSKQVNKHTRTHTQASSTNTNTQNNTNKHKHASAQRDTYDPFGP